MDSRGHTGHFHETHSPVHVHVVIYNNMSGAGTQCILCLSSVLLDLSLKDLVSSISNSSGQDICCDASKCISWLKKEEEKNLQ